MNRRRGDHELRFTRNRPGVVLCVLSLPVLLAGMATALWGFSAASGGPASPQGWFRLLLAGAIFMAGAGCFLFGVELLRRTYVVATPLGLDILPLLRPATRMILIGWHELEGVTLRGSRLVLVRRSGSPVCIRGLRAYQARLLDRLIQGRLSQLSGSPAAQPSQPGSPPCP